MAIVGYWRLNGNSNDASGNGNNGTDTSITYGQTYGKVNSGALFNHINDKIVIENESNFDFERTDKFTISMWLKRTTNNVDRYLLCKQEASGNYRGWAVWQKSSNVFALDLISVPVTSHLGAISPAFTSITNWYYLTFIYTGTSNYAAINIYVNSIKQSLVDVVHSLTTTILNSINVEIGNRAGSTFNMAGSLDDVIIDNTAWSNSKVKNEYARVKGFF